jgi:hypothetical protein
VWLGCALGRVAWSCCLVVDLVDQVGVKVASWLASGRSESSGPAMNFGVGRGQGLVATMADLLVERLRRFSQLGRDWPAMNRYMIPVMICGIIKMNMFNGYAMEWDSLNQTPEQYFLRKLYPFSGFNLPSGVWEFSF